MNTVDREGRQLNHGTIAACKDVMLGAYAKFGTYIEYFSGTSEGFTAFARYVESGRCLDLRSSK